MMGKQAAPEQLFHDFRLDDHVPADHLLRQIDIFVDLERIRQDLKPFYSQTGRPSVDAELMIRMLIIGYRYGIRCERRLCEDVHLDLAYRWIFSAGSRRRSSASVDIFKLIGGGGPIAVMAAFARVICFATCSRP